MTPDLETRIHRFVRNVRRAYDFETMGMRDKARMLFEGDTEQSWQLRQRHAAAKLQREIEEELGLK